VATVPFNAAVPLYHQIAQELRLRVRAGLIAGGRFPTEAQLCAEFGVSRTAVRQALAVLKGEGLLESRRGVGTRVVAVQWVPRYTRSAGDPLHARLDTRPRIVEMRACPAPPDVAAFFGLPPSAPAFRVLRVHEMDGSPLSVVDSWLRAEVGARLSRAALARSTLHDLLWQKAGVRQARSEHRIRVGRASARIASLLDIGLSDPVLLVHSSVTDDTGTPVRWTENHFREDRYEYVAQMQWKAPAPTAGRRKAPRGEGVHR
jgi:DNA-binding GntR family transcriptional regulator